MASITSMTYAQAITTVLGMELNSLVTNWISNAAGSGSGLDLYLVATVDGTNYEVGSAPSANVQSSSAYYAGLFLVRAVTTAQCTAVTGLRPAPTKYKINSTGKSLAASANIVAYRKSNLTVA